MEPFPFRDFRTCIQPISQGAQLVCCDLTLLDPVQQVLQQGGWKIMPADLRHGSGRGTVKTPADLFSQPGGFLGVRGMGQLFSQTGQLPAAYPLLGLLVMNLAKHLPQILCRKLRQLLKNLCHAHLSKSKPPPPLFNFNFSHTPISHLPSTAKPVPWLRLVGARLHSRNAQLDASFPPTRRRVDR